MHRDQEALAQRYRTRGFTLVEVLVTLVVFSILSISGITILNQSISTKDQVDRVNHTVEQLRRTHALFKADFAQLVPRETRDQFGTPSGTVFSGGVSYGNQPILQFVRDGWDNPSGLERRSSLQRVDYLLKGNDLVRRAYVHLESGAEDHSIDLIMLEDVAALGLSFFVKGQWYDAWTVSRGEGLPQAVAVTLRAAELGDIRLMFQTSGLSL